MDPKIRCAEIGPSSLYAEFVEYRIDKKTSIETFNKMVEKALCDYDSDCNYNASDYTLGSYYNDHNALSRAAQKGNLPLIVHIVEIGGKNLLNIGNRHGATPLLFCIYQAALLIRVRNIQGPQWNWVSKKAELIVPTKLCALGTDLNLTNTHGWKDYFVGNIPAGVTPLWMAAEKTSNLNLVKMLISYGAMVDYSLLSAHGEEMMAKATEELFHENKGILLAYMDPKSTLGVLPEELLSKITKLKITLNLKA